jgi:hypothetical protein
MKARLHYGSHNSPLKTSQEPLKGLETDRLVYLSFVRAVLFCEPSIKGAARDRVFFLARIEAKHSLLITALNEQPILALGVLLGPCVL